ncbi:set and mynd domain containing protein, putative [Entamoeba invadens IP1]|uniref:Set and mynd domain containing protein, putative n=1 Tax=Entamoeba invadens IP1 TaxID=370355 RepID=A0A0A1UEB9_ENTIV|nr:set and mynd domain containing protein, putative [Entamoeba invadens IP1]ELP94930.1 set and mynd domain containing protein, putative [Entamoeba invadens IP1]|eukprot:XP_004261701.1 set and mynd domain containing protein, putative [Entamoeba invadens IP1]
MSLYNVKESTGKGRGVFLNTDITEKTEVVHSKLIGGCLNYVEWKFYCEYCFKELKENSKISCGCGFNYCSMECQKKAYDEYHKNECSIIKSLREIPDGIGEILLLYRCSIKTVKWEDYCSLPNINNYKAVEYCVLLFKSNSSLLKTIWEVIQANSFCLTNGEEQVIGIGLFDYASFINHSCCPNCVPLQNKREMSIKSLTSIKSGEEIFISYIDITESFERREKELRKWHFSCGCSLCEEDKKRYRYHLLCECGGSLFVDEIGQFAKCKTCKKVFEEGDDKYEDALYQINEYRNLENDIDKLSTNKQYEQVIEKLNENVSVITSLIDEKDVREHYKFNSIMFHSFIQLKKYNEAAQVGKKLMKMVDTIFPLLYITGVVEHFHLAKVFRMSGDENLFQEEIEKVRLGISILDDSHCLVKEFNEYVIAIK